MMDRERLARCGAPWRQRGSDRASVGAPYVHLIPMAL